MWATICLLPLLPLCCCCCTVCVFLSIASTRCIQRLNRGSCLLRGASTKTDSCFGAFGSRCVECCVLQCVVVIATFCCLSWCGVVLVLLVPTAHICDELGLSVAD